MEQYRTLPNIYRVNPNLFQNTTPQLTPSIYSLE